MAMDLDFCHCNYKTYKCNMGIYFKEKINC